jgi:hypothetical protein
MDTESKRSLEQKLTDDGWIIESEFPLILLHISSRTLTGQAAHDLFEHYKKGGRYGKQ